MTSELLKVAVSFGQAATRASAMSAGHKLSVSLAMVRHAMHFSLLSLQPGRLDVTDLWG